MRKHGDPSQDRNIPSLVSKVSVFHGKAVHVTERPKVNRRDKLCYECRMNISGDVIGYFVPPLWPMSPGGKYYYHPKTKEAYDVEMLEDISGFLRKINGMKIKK